MVSITTGGFSFESFAIRTASAWNRPRLRLHRAALDKQALDVAILDVHDLIVITDFFVICTGSTDRQVKTVVEEVEKALRDQLSLKPVRREGDAEAQDWVLLDYVDVLVHVFAPEEREYNDLERLWRDAPRVNMDEGGVAARVR